MSIQQLIDSKILENAINQYEEVVIVKKDNNVIVMSMKEYKDQKLKNDIIEKLKKSEREIDNGEGINSDIAFKELREKYEY